MTTTIICLFFIGYLCIAMEHPLKIDKTATALLLGMLLWILYALGAQYIVPEIEPEALKAYVSANPSLAGESLQWQSLQYILDIKIVEALGDITQTLFFLIGAMTIVEMIDVHGGFSVITDRITTRDKRRLLWIMLLTAFIFSAVLDNMTTTIVMIMLIRKLVDDKHEQWIYAALVVIAANCGGAWSPIGDVTTIMLWVKGNVTAPVLMTYVTLPSVVACVVPALWVSRKIKGKLTYANVHDSSAYHNELAKRDKVTMFILGVAGLIFVPVFKSFTHMPPFIGMLLVLGLLWIYTEIFYNRRKNIPGAKQYRIPQIIQRIDLSSILFFLGILMAVDVLDASGILSATANWLDTEIHNIYIINIVLGLLSSVFDNVPLVAGVMGMYPVADPSAVGYMANFVQDGIFWEFLSYCAGVGGSMLIIGSAAGVIAMGLEKISFGWYMKHFSIPALVGYLCGAGVYILEAMFLK